MTDRLRLGFLGASRGMSYAAHFPADYPYARVAAICEAYAPLCEKAGGFFRERGEQVECYTDLDRFLDESGIDALIIANFANAHAPVAIRALQKGVHVFSEVMPTQTLAEAVQLCDAVERSGCVYAYGENYCYFASCFAMRRAYEAGGIGEAVCLEGTFINDCSFKWDLLTRGVRDHWRNYVPSTFYCSHSIGPMLYSTGRRAVRVNGFEIPRMNYMAAVGARSGSAAMELMELDNGGVARSMNGNLRHPYETSYRLIGEEGSIECDFRSARLHRHKTGAQFELTELEHLPSEFAFRPDGGTGVVDDSDCSAIGYFIGTIFGDALCKKYTIDVYRALDMAMPGLLAYRSIVSGGAPFSVPDFRDREIRARYAEDHYSTSPDAPEGFRLPTTKNGTPDVPESVYEAVRGRFAAQDLTPGQK